MWQQRGYGVIVGGGVTGTAMLYQLAKRGVQCVLFEKGELTCGATWHAAGLVTRFHGGNNFRLWHDEVRASGRVLGSEGLEIRPKRRVLGGFRSFRACQGVNLFTQWQSEGTPLSFHTPGSIRLIPNEFEP